MNRFRTYTKNFALFCFLAVLAITKPAFAQADVEAPVLIRGNHIYADIDTAGQVVYLFFQEELWKYDLQNDEWKELVYEGKTEEPIESYQFGFNHKKSSLYVWASGAGQVYEIDLAEEKLKLERIDRSFLHKNQFGHFPFFRDGILYAFGGYGMWEWHNILTYFNNEIKEWNLQNVHIDSDFPAKRVPYYGRYLAEQDELFIIGGDGSAGNRQDDKYTLFEKYDDVWSYSFKTEKWRKHKNLNFNGTEFYSPSMDRRIGEIGLISASFYSSESGIWYLPVKLNESSAGFNYLLPYHISRSKELPFIEIPLQNSEAFIVSNYMFNSKTNELIVIGLNWLSNSEKLPVKVIRIPEEELLQQIDLAELNKKSIHVSGWSLFGLSVSVIAVFLFLYNRKKNGNKTNLKFSLEDITNFEWLNDDEKRTLQILMNADEPLETMEMEELIWPDITNYDYRRKLRNETIKSINKKFSQHFPNSVQVIHRKKDPNDNRRFRYMLEKDLVSL